MSLKCSLLMEIAAVLIAAMCFFHGFDSVSPAAAEGPAGITRETITRETGLEETVQTGVTLDVEDCIRRFEDLYRADSSFAVIEFTVKRPRKTRTLMMKSWTRGQEKSLIIIDKPPREAGIATLRVEQNLWNYLPRISRTIRIPPSMLRGAWMGSDFTNDDLVKESSYLNDYTYSLKGRSTDPPGWRIEFQARPEVVGLWERIELVVDEEGTIPLIQEFYDRKNRLSRIMVFDQVEEFDGRRIPSRLVVTPTRETGKSTEVKYLDIDFKVDIPDSTFSLSRLEQKR